MSNYQQKNIEQYLEEHNIDDEQLKARFLQKITQTIHDRNDLVIELEKTEDEYKQNQIKSDIDELDEKIEEKFEEFLSQN
ncbi:MAG: hypothetical protein ABEJ24_04435 [Candidatus Magasanikbacteria bacterium]